MPQGERESPPGDGNKDKLFAYRPFVHISLFMDVLTSQLRVDYLPVNIETSNEAGSSKPNLVP